MQQDFQSRLVGTTLLLPLAVAVFMGGVFATLAILIVCIFLIIEFAALLSDKKSSQIVVAFYLALPPTICMLGQVELLALIVLVLGFGAFTYVKGLIPGLYAASLSLCFSSFVFLVAMPYFFLQLLGVAVVIACVDIGAYIVGKSVGGPKLAPRISPKKTVSGGVGGLAFGMIAGLLVGSAFGLPASMSLVLAALVAVIAQLGDLLESALKRQVNVKDSSNFIPGHGGFLDRFDGYVFVMPLLVILNFMIWASV